MVCRPREDLRFQTADEFTDWWTRVGFMCHREIRDSFLNWQTGNFPEAVEDDESISWLRSSPWRTTGRSNYLT
jgi:hypothetical protein